MLRLMCAFYLNICWFCSFVFSIFCSFSYLPVGYLKVFLEFCFDLSLQMCSFVFLRFCLVESFLLCRLLCLRSTGLHSSYSALACRWAGFSCCIAQPSGAQASEIATCRLYSTGSVVVAHRPSCPMACGIFLEQRSNLYPLSWQADS